MLRKLIKDESGYGTMLFALAVLSMSVLYLTLTSDLGKIMTTKTILIKASISAGKAAVKQTDDSSTTTGVTTINLTRAKQAAHNEMLKNIPSSWPTGNEIKYLGETVTITSDELIVQAQVYLPLSKYNGNGRVITVTYPTKISNI